MPTILNAPVIILVVTFSTLWGAAHLGDYVRTRFRPIKEEEREDFRSVMAASLTLLGLIIGFSFSMAISRYDQRKNYEEAEANAIGTEYVRADLLPSPQAVRVRELLKRHLDQRVLFYTVRDQHQLQQINQDTAQLQTELWSAIRETAATQPTPIVALVAAGMNDVLNSEGYTQAAWWNRIPTASWCLMAAIAVCCHLLLGYDARKTNALLFLIFPLIVSIAFFLIADIDSPRGGAIQVHPQNLKRLVQALNAQSPADPRSLTNRSR
jgi:hypothetical protein